MRVNLGVLSTGFVYFARCYFFGEGGFGVVK